MNYSAKVCLIVLVKFRKKVLETKYEHYKSNSYYLSQRKNFFSIWWCYCRSCLWIKRLLGLIRASCNISFHDQHYILAQNCKMRCETIVKAYFFERFMKNITNLRFCFQQICRPGGGGTSCFQYLYCWPKLTTRLGLWSNMIRLHSKIRVEPKIMQLLVTITWCLSQIYLFDRITYSFKEKR